MIQFHLYFTFFVWLIVSARIVHVGVHINFNYNSFEFYLNTNTFLIIINYSIYQKLYLLI
jgi:hypothetical protein